MEVEGVVVLVAHAVEQVERGLERFDQVLTRRLQCPAGRRRPGRGGSAAPRWPGRTALSAWRTGSRPAAAPADRRASPRRALHVAGDPVLLEPADPSERPERRIEARDNARRQLAAAEAQHVARRLLEQRRPGQGPVAARRSGPATARRARHGGAGHSRCRTIGARSRGHANNACGAGAHSANETRRTRRCGRLIIDTLRARVLGPVRRRPVGPPAAAARPGGPARRPDRLRARAARERRRPAHPHAGRPRQRPVRAGAAAGGHVQRRS